MAEMTPDIFFESFVLKDYEDWDADPDSIRKAFHSAVSAYHLADNYFLYYQRHNQEFKRKYNELRKVETVLTALTPSFKIIRDMATVYKHLYPMSKCEILSGGSIERITYGNQGIERIEHEYLDNSGGQGGSIVIRRKGNSDVWFADTIKDVIEMWGKIMEGHQPRL